MYAPRQTGIPHDVRDNVRYAETAPPRKLREILYCTWELQTAAPLGKDCLYLVLPDACTDIIFDVRAADPADGAFIMASGTDATEINLGRSFHYVGLRFFPGVLDSRNAPDRQALAQVWRQLKAAPNEADRRIFLHACTASLLAQKKAAKNYLMYRMLVQNDGLQTVRGLAELSGYTPGQLQRICKQQTGFTPRELLKVLRFQRTLAGESDHPYADQAHLIREFKRITGLTPKVFKATY